MTVRASAKIVILSGVIRLLVAVSSARARAAHSGAVGEWLLGHHRLDTDQPNRCNDKDMGPYHTYSWNLHLGSRKRVNTGIWTRLQLQRRNPWPDIYHRGPFR